MDANLIRYVPAVSFDPPMVRPVMIPHRRGKYIKFADAKESLSKSHNMQAKAQIAARIDRFVALGHWRHDSDCINVFVADLRQLLHG